MAMFGPAAQARFSELANYMAVGSQTGRMPGQRIPGGLRFTRDMVPRVPFANFGATRAALRQETAQLNALRALGGGGMNSLSPSTVISPGPTQVIRPSAQAPQRQAAPQAGASSSLITSTPSPAEVALATTTLLGG